MTDDGAVVITSLGIVSTTDESTSLVIGRAL